MKLETIMIRSAKSGPRKSSKWQQQQCQKPENSWAKNKRLTYKTQFNSFILKIVAKLKVTMSWKWKSNIKTYIKVIISAKDLVKHMMMLMTLSLVRQNLMQPKLLLWRLRKRGCILKLEKHWREIFQEMCLWQNSMEHILIRRSMITMIRWLMKHGVRLNWWIKLLLVLMQHSKIRKLKKNGWKKRQYKQRWRSIQLRTARLLMNI